MTEYAVEVRNLTKTFRRGAIGAVTLKEEIQDAYARLTRAEQPSSRREFRALDEVSFSIPKGTVCGVVGPNGSGKTTLMKILSSIIEPTAGEAILRGRVGSLLEVGAGFEWELNGIENIYMNGAILGMSRKEINRKLDQIIAFADIGPALETPVKRYSSGMFVRLAFAVSAHLESNILIVDEVLAVGDAEFQRKCIGAMEDVASQGRTVILVSHNMATIGQLCDSALYLRGGKLKATGPVRSVIDSYLSDGPDASEGELTVEAGPLTASLSLVETETSRPTRTPIFGAPHQMVLRLASAARLPHMVASIRIATDHGELISTLGTTEEGLDLMTIDGEVEVAFDLGELALAPGSYFADLSVARFGDDAPMLHSQAPYAFKVQPAMVRGSGSAYSREHGPVRIARSATVRTLRP